MFSRWDVESSGFALESAVVRICRETQRRWRSCEDERIYSRFGCVRRAPWRWPQTGNDGWRTVTVRQRAIGSRHHVGMCVAWRRQITKKSHWDGRSGHHCRRERKGTLSSSTCRHELGWSSLLWKLGRRIMFFFFFPHGTDPDTCTERDSTQSETCWADMTNTMVLFNRKRDDRSWDCISGDARKRQHRYSSNSWRRRGLPLCRSCRVDQERSAHFCDTEFYFIPFVKKISSSFF